MQLNDQFRDISGMHLKLCYIIRGNKFKLCSRELVLKNYANMEESHGLSLNKSCDQFTQRIKIWMLHQKGIHHFMTLSPYILAFFWAKSQFAVLSTYQTSFPFFFCQHNNINLMVSPLLIYCLVPRKIKGLFNWYPIFFYMNYRHFYYISIRATHMFEKDLATSFPTLIK